MKLNTLTKAMLLLSIGVFAGSDHFHPKKIAKCAKICTADEVKSALPEAITYLNKWGKIDLVWAGAKVDSVEQKPFKKGPEWVLTLVNEKEVKRYVFVTLDGYVTGSNSTGN